MSVENVATVMFYWVLYELKYKYVMLFEQIQHWDTVVNDNNFVCAECHNWLQNQQVQMGGFDANGQPMYTLIFEADETYFFHCKYHRGRLRRGRILKHASGRCWLEIVARRNAQTLERTMFFQEVSLSLIHGLHMLMLAN